MAGMAAFILIITAVSGYIFSDQCVKYKYLLPREDGQRLYLRSLVFGLPFLVLCFSISELLFWLSHHFEFIPVSLGLKEETQWMLIGFGTFLSSWVLAQAYNWKVGDIGRRLKFFEAMQKNDFERILSESMQQLEPVAISMDNRKFYVGMVYDSIEPELTSSYLTIIPFLSGYRDKDTLDVNLQVKYEPVLDALQLETGASGNKTINTEVLKKYFMVVPRDRITSIHLYNPELYDHARDQLSVDKTQ